ncbi:hypothetical protein HDU82_001302 [Entophlyctis luteolus]|nr:hypothetical protein HDU82_001302 [Entophlyctis luteolus]
MRWDICLRRCSVPECEDPACCACPIGSVDLVIPLPSFAPTVNSSYSNQPHYYDLWQAHEQHPPILASRIDPHHAGNGYSTEAVKAVLLHVFNNGTPVSKRLSRVHAAFADSNPVKSRAAKILKRLGFSVAERVSPSMSRSGVPIDGWTLFECKRDEFMDLWTDNEGNLKSDEDFLSLRSDLRMAQEQHSATVAIVPVSDDSDFPLENIPFGIISTQENPTHRPATAIGDYAVDLKELAAAGLFDGPLLAPVAVKPTLNAFMRLGQPHWREARATLQRLLVSTTASRLRDEPDFRARVLIPLSRARTHIPAAVGDYTDFYSSREHAVNVGTMFRGRDNALQPNWVHLPVGYHGRASSVVVSGTRVRRPVGLVQDAVAKRVVFGECRKLDYELETAFFVGGPTNALGDRIDIDDAERHIFGMVLMNDWSARDIQAFEYVPLGPFLGKNFGTTISPWIVTMDALEPFRVAQPPQDPTPAKYLRAGPMDAYDIRLHATLTPKGSATAFTIARTNFKYLYWSMKQQLAHHTINGCNMNPGDLLGSGTISGPDPGSVGSLLEASLNGAQELNLSGDGIVKRKFIEDGDSVSITGTCEGVAGGRKIRIGFGVCEGTVIASAIGEFN